MEGWSDPFGHEWGINQQLKKQTDEETQAAAAEFSAKQKHVITWRHL